MPDSPFILEKKLPLKHLTTDLSAMKCDTDISTCVDPQHQHLHRTPLLGHKSLKLYSWYAEYPICSCLHLNEVIESLLGGKICLRLMQQPIDSGVISIITPLSHWDLCLNEHTSSLMPFPFILALV